MFFAYKNSDMENMKMVSSPKWTFVATYATSTTDVNIPAVRMGSGAPTIRDDRYSGELGLAMLRTAYDASIASHFRTTWKVLTRCTPKILFAHPF